MTYTIYKKYFTIEGMNTQISTQMSHEMKDLLSQYMIEKGFESFSGLIREILKSFLDNIYPENKIKSIHIYKKKV